jgi:isopenicillin N synthase-like dioxygenase
MANSDRNGENVAGHGVAAALFDGLLAATRRFFALTEPEKMKVYIGRSKNHRGYVPEGEEVFAGGTKDKKDVPEGALGAGRDHAARQDSSPVVVRSGSAA